MQIELDVLEDIIQKACDYHGDTLWFDSTATLWDAIVIAAGNGSEVKNG